MTNEDEKTLTSAIEGLAEQIRRSGGAMGNGGDSDGAGSGSNNFTVKESLKIIKQQSQADQRSRKEFNIAQSKMAGVANQFYTTVKEYKKHTEALSKADMKNTDNILAGTEQLANYGGKFLDEALNATVSVGHLTDKLPATFKEILKNSGSEFLTAIKMDDVTDAFNVEDIQKTSIALSNAMAELSSDVDSFEKKKVVAGLIDSLEGLHPGVMKGIEGLELLRSNSRSNGNVSNILTDVQKKLITETITLTDATATLKNVTERQSKGLYGSFEKLKQGAGNAVKGFFSFNKAMALTTYGVKQSYELGKSTLRTGQGFTEGMMAFTKGMSGQDWQQLRLQNSQYALALGGNGEWVAAMEQGQAELLGVTGDMKTTQELKASLTRQMQGMGVNVSGDTVGNEMSKYADQLRELRMLTGQDASAINAQTEAFLSSETTQLALSRMNKQQRIAYRDQLMTTIKYNAILGRTSEQTLKLEDAFNSMSTQMDPKKRMKSAAQLGGLMGSMGMAGGDVVRKYFSNPNANPQMKEQATRLLGQFTQKLATMRTSGVDSQELLADRYQAMIGDMGAVGEIANQVNPAMLSGTKLDKEAIARAEKNLDDNKNRDDLLTNLVTASQTASSFFTSGAGSLITGLVSGLGSLILPVLQFGMMANLMKGGPMMGNMGKMVGGMGSKAGGMLAGMAGMFGMGGKGGGSLLSKAGGFLKGKGGGLLLKGGLAGVAGLAGNYLGDSIGGKTGSVVSGMASGAATGAMIGSIIPGLGTAIGAGIGGVVGGAMSYFGDDDSSSGSSSETTGSLTNQSADMLVGTIANMNDSFNSMDTKLADISYTLKELLTITKEATGSSDMYYQDSVENNRKTRTDMKFRSGRNRTQETSSYGVPV